MLDPTVVHPNWDYREFGDMFFDRGKDPLEIDNRIADTAYRDDINTLRGYYKKFTENTPATGKEELVQNQTRSNGQKRPEEMEK
jgi:hypothetical protein